MLQLKPTARRPSITWPSPFTGTQFLPTLAASEDFEGTETLLRKEINEGWQEPKEAEE